MSVTRERGGCRDAGAGSGDDGGGHRDGGGQPAGRALRLSGRAFRQLCCDDVRRGHLCGQDGRLQHPPAPVSVFAAGPAAVASGPAHPPGHPGLSGGAGPQPVPVFPFVPRHLPLQPALGAPPRKGHPPGAPAGHRGAAGLLLAAGVPLGGGRPVLDAGAHAAGVPWLDRGQRAGGPGPALAGLLRHHLPLLQAQHAPCGAGLAQRHRALQHVRHPGPGADL